MKKYFRTPEDRNLWLRLRAEFHIEFSKRVNCLDIPMGDIDVPFSALRVANNELTTSEHSEWFKFTLAELASLHYDDLYQIYKSNERRFCQQFKKTIKL